MPKTQAQLTPIGEQLLFDYVLNDLSTTYDRVYNIANKMFKKHNPCNIHTTKKGFVLCKKFYHYKHVNQQQKQGRFLCCSACEHQSETGCPVKCLPCKLFCCSSVNNKAVINKLYKLRCLAEKHGIDLFPYYRTKDEILSDSLKIARRPIPYYKYE